MPDVETDSIQQCSEERKLEAKDRALRSREFSGACFPRSFAVEKFLILAWLVDSMPDHRILIRIFGCAAHGIASRLVSCVRLRLSVLFCPVESRQMCLLSFHTICTLIQRETIAIMTDNASSHTLPPRKDRLSRFTLTRLRPMFFTHRTSTSVEQFKRVSSLLSIPQRTFKICP